MKIIQLLLIILFITACKPKKEEQVEKNNPESNFLKITPDFFRHSIDLDSHTTLKQEYVILKNDSFLNQKRIYKKGIIDTLNSKFYDLKSNKSDSINYSGNIYYRGFLDSLDLKINTDRWVNLIVVYKTPNDSIVEKTFESIDGNNIFYNISEFKKGSIRAYIEDSAIVPNNENDSIDIKIKKYILEEPMQIEIE